MTTTAYSDWQLYKRLLSYMLPFVGALLLSIGGNLMFAMMQVLTADTMQLVVDSFGVDKAALDGELAHGLISTFINQVLQPFLGATYSPVFWVPFMVVAITLLRGLGSFLGSYYLDVVGRSTVHNLRCALYDHLLLMPVGFFDSTNNSFLVNRVTFNVQQVAQAVTRALMIVVREGFTVIGMVAYMLYLDWALTLLFLLIIPLIALVISYVSKRFRRLSKRVQNSMGGVTHVTSESLAGIRAVKIFAGEHYERDRFVKVSDYNMRQSLKIAKTDAIASPVMQVLVAGALACLIAYGLRPEFSNTLSSGSFVAFLTAAGLIGKPLKQLGNVLNIIQKGLAAAEDIFIQMDTPLESNHGQVTLQRARGDIEIKNLYFKYRIQTVPETSREPDTNLANLESTDKACEQALSNHEQPSDDWILKNINAQIKRGQMIALVGRSGSGKSTLVNLLPRFYTVTEGQIRLDGQDISDFELTNLRTHFSLVSQQITLFNDTLYNNIAYGSLRDSDPAAVEEAMRIAHVSEFVQELPEREQTLVGDQGVLLSGGQRQRIAIARAILKDAPVLVLDEATSALDNDSERFIQNALEEVMKNRTSIVIAHRLSTIEKADEIWVMEHGEIIERGTHKQLLELDGAYAELYQSQFQS